MQKKREANTRTTFRECNIDISVNEKEKPVCRVDDKTTDEFVKILVSDENECGNEHSKSWHSRSAKQQIKWIWEKTFPIRVSLYSG